MYCSPGNRQEDEHSLYELIRQHPLGTLITHGPSGLMANLVPFVLACDAEGAPCLRAHLARANPQLAEIAAGSELLVQFQGPEAYISPSWYASKADQGKAVPTWNYAVVQVQGTGLLCAEPAWLLAQVTALSQQQESGRAHPWQVSDAPAAYIQGMLKAICGIEIRISQIQGKWKLGQNRDEADWVSLQAGLATEPGQAELLTLMQQMK